MNFLFLLGILALIQITILPGLLLLKWIKLPQGGILQKVLYCFSLSLIANYCGGFILTLIHIYIPLTVYIIYTLEILACLWLYRSDLRNSLENIGASSFQSIDEFLSSVQEKLRKFNNHDIALTLSLAVLGIVAIYFTADSILWLSNVFLNKLGGIFELGDAVKNWNPWAVIWSHGQIPPARIYGQLIPVNWSLTYQFMRNSQVQFFAVAIMPLFALFTLLLFLDLGLTFKNIGFFLALIFTRYMMKKYAGTVIDDGYVDIAIMFFYLLPVHALIKCTQTEDPEAKKKYLLIGFIFAAGAAVTKQTGLSILAAFPVLAYFLVVRNIPRGDRRSFLISLAKFCLLALFIAVPWYVISRIMIFTGQNAAMLEAFASADFYKQSALSRLWQAILIIQKYNLLFFLALIAIPFVKPIYRWLTITIVFPYAIIWAIFLSYDTRNLTPVIPIVSLAAGVGIEAILFRLEGLFKWSRVARVKAYAILIIGILAVVIISQRFPDRMLIDRQIELQKQLFFPQLNKVIYSQVDKFGPDVLIYTDGYPFDALPGLAHNIAFVGFPSLDTVETVLSEHPEVKVLVLSKSSKSVMVAYFLQNQSKFVLVAELGDYLVVDVPGH